MRVHVQSDAAGPGDQPGYRQASWNMGRLPAGVAEQGRGVIVLLARCREPEQLLASIDMALGNRAPAAHVSPDSYTTVGLGSQILKDLGWEKST